MENMTSDNAPAATETAYGAFSRESVERLSRERNEPAWMRAKRLRAWTIFTEMPGQTGNPALPVSRRIEFKELRLEELKRESKTTTATAGTATVVADGVILSTLESALRDHPELVEKYFMSDCVQINDSKFAALHAAFWDAGTFLYVPKNVRVEVPVECLVGTGAGSGAVFPHTLIVADEGSAVTVVERYRSGEGSNGQQFIDSVVEIVAQQGATVRYIGIQTLGLSAYNFAFKKALVKKDASVSWHEAGIGSRVSHSNVQLVLDESGATGELFGIYFPGGEQQMEFDTLQVHAAPSTKSNLLYKGALQEKSKTVFNGIIQVHKGAQRTDAYQANRNILLSSDARADSIPTLEIEANDVRCTHGATVGPVDEEVIYYLMSRGLSRDEARRMLVVGFLVPVIDAIPVESVREEILGAVRSRIGS